MAFRRQHVSDDLSPEAREARIAELRARRRARLRKLAVRSALGMVLLAVLVVVLVWWLLMTLGGRDFLLGQVAMRLPAGTELTWGSAEGPASGPLTMYDVRYVQRGCPDVDGEPVAYGDCDEPTVLSFAAERVTIDPAILPLIGRRLRLDVLDIDNAVLALPPPVDTPFELPRWPESLPRIDLPLSLQADTIRIDGFRVERMGEGLIDIHTLRGGIDAQQGELQLENIVVDSDRGRFTAHGVYAPDDDYRMDLTASALMPAPLGRTRPRIGLVARGDLSSLDVAVVGHAPEPLRVVATLRGRDRPGWALRANTSALDPGLLAGSGEPGTPLAFDLTADGVGGSATLQGRFAMGAPEDGGLSAVLQPSRIRIEEQVLEVEPLVLDIFDGRVTARGNADFSTPEDVRFRFAVNARGLQFGADPDAAEPAPPISADADLGFAGRSAAWAAIGKATIERDTLQASVDFDGRGDSERMRLQTARVTMPTGTLDATGEVAWAPALQWDVDAALAGFDPGYFARDWKGAVDGTLASTGSTRDDGGLEITAEASDLGGTLRGRRLDGRATFALHGAASDAGEAGRSDFDAEVSLSLGGSRVDATATVTDTLDIDASLAPLQLADFLPDAGGVLRGTLRVTGPRTAPDVAADLTGSDLRYGDYQAASARIQGRLPWRSDSGTLDVVATGVNAGVALDEVRLAARGAVEKLQLDASARGEIGSLQLDGSAERRNDNWQGTLSTLRLAPATGASWALQAPAQFRQIGTRYTLGESCFTSSGGGSLCASADWPQRGVSIAGSGLPLSLATPYLPEQDGGRPFALRGEIAIEGSARPVGNGFAGSARISSATGGVRTAERARNEILSYEDLVFDAEFDASRLSATLSTTLNEAGRIRAEVSNGWDAYSPLAGTLVANVEDLTFVELFSPDIVEPTGRLTANISLGGTRAQPTIGGQARLSDFATELPSLAIALEDGNVALDALPDGTARIAGSLRSGEGTLNVDGTLGWQGDDTPLVLNLRGENVTVSDTSDLHVIADPDITVRYAARQPLNVTGTVAVPIALLDLERLSEGVSASPDVVVLDPVDPDASAASPLELDLTLRMGDAVALRGFGFDGMLGGNLRVRAVPGREMTGSGRLEVAGKYKAYGQELRVTRGNLTFSNGPVSDPILDIRAERRIEAEDITAGVDVSGRASAPQVNVWTDPASDNSQALSYLALGRSTSSLTSAEGQQIDAAAAALNAGGSLLASQIGSRIGLDEAGISDSRALGGSVLGVGKQISPRLYVGFGVSLLGTGQVLTLKYMLSRGFDVEIESSTLESRGSVNWRRER
ncbi:translocation/assembly module TamB domain-containing protein [Luteimonas sp. BDR2-5]|uniref:translocation/assembly module TamB domain-containing protein n=1 Tax=Proluteimonas luteida TaxID=2878685 RepID=UPI001E559BE5|nr:translocation/assembly module TamB domain-containing protein [Luteimonas sp. BDR2-5]MCD9029121.1 translocation/assembly module TamB domain-containing protein [Luteimonas sp. BDR2-5]